MRDVQTELRVAGRRVDEWAAPSEIGSKVAGRLKGVCRRGRELRRAPLDLQLAVARARGLDDRVAAIERAAKLTRR